MASYSNNVVDGSGYRRPIPGMKVYVLNRDGSLAASATPNPAESDDYGEFSFTADDDVYVLDYRLAGVTYAKETVTVGAPPQYVGPPGASDNTYTSLSAFKASDIGRKTASLVGVPDVPDGRFYWTLGDYTGQADEVNIIKADSTALSTGAQVRQKADGIAQVQTGTGAVIESLGTSVRRMGIWPEQFGARVGGFDDARLQKALDAVPNGGRLYLADEFVISAGTLQLVNRSGVMIYGPGILRLDGGAPDMSLLLRSVGTCSNVLVQGITFRGPGRGDENARHQGVSNTSGQTLSNFWVDQCTFEDLNLGVAFNAESGGSFGKGFITRNVLRRMKGTVGGQGYGIFSARATDILIANNEIEDAERHSIYVSNLADNPGAHCGVVVDGNIIRGHRRTIASGGTRVAIYMGRGFGGRISNNLIMDYYDGAIGVGHDSGGPDNIPPPRSTGDVEIVGNRMFGRKNAVPSIQIAEPLIPTTATTQRVDISGNSFFADIGAAGAQLEIEVYNGKDITARDNDFYLSNVPNATGLRLISLGTYAGAGDAANIYVERNRINGVAASPSTVNFSVVRLAANICTGSAKVVVRDNDNDTGFITQNVEYDAARTNPNIIDNVRGQLVAGVYVAGDTSPSVANGVQYLLFNNSSPTSITTLDDAVLGQQVVLKFTNGNTTITAGSGINLAASAVGSLRRTITLVRVSGGWDPVADITGA